MIKTDTDIKKMFKTVLFDLDDTIFDFQKAEHEALKKTLFKFDIEPTEQTMELYSKINKRQWQLLEEGKFTRAEICVRRFKLLFEKLGLNCSPEDVNEEYKKLLGIGHYFIPGAQELLEGLWQKFDLYIVSNGNLSVQQGRLASADISKYFKEIFISEEIGADKPCVEFFNYCFSQIPDFKKEETIIIGDSLTSDIRGGNNAGITTCWFNPHRKESMADVRIDYEISDLSEIPGILYGF